MLLDYVYAVSLLVIALVTLLAVLHPRFNDNTLQRVGLCGMCFGASLRLYTFLGGQDLQNLRFTLTIGMAFYLLGTVAKFRKFDSLTRGNR